MATISSDSFTFLQDLSSNNTREWFTENKQRYEVVKKNFEEFITELIKRISDFDPLVADLSAKKAIFRIHRDTRFSKDKTPYKTNIGAHIVSISAKPHDRAGYYVHLEPGKSMIAGGAYLPPAAWIKAIRQEIAYNADEFRSIIAHPDFKKHFGEMEGEQLKTAPRDYPKDHPEIELLKYKSFLASRTLLDKEVTDTGFLDTCTAAFKALKPFDDFLNRVMD